MLKWTHVICQSCYREKEPDREPVVVKEASTEICCFCNKATGAGIYYRADPNTTKYCKHE